MRFGTCLHHCRGLLCGGPPFALHIVYNYLCALGIACIIVEVCFAEDLRSPCTLFTITYALWELLAPLWRCSLWSTSLPPAHYLQCLVHFGDCLHHCGGLLSGGPPCVQHIICDDLCTLGNACILVEVCFAEDLRASSTLFAMTYALWGLLASLWRSALRRTSVRPAHYLR